MFSYINFWKRKALLLLHIIKFEYYKLGVIVQGKCKAGDHSVGCV